MTHHEIGYIQREGKPPLPVKKWDGENTSSALLSNVPYLMHGSVPKFLEDSVHKKEFNSSATFHEDRKKHSRPVMGPQQKYNHPVTESQIVGWHAHENLQRVSPLTGDVVRLGQPGRTYHGLKSSDVTRHADGLFATSNRLQGK